MRKFAEMDRRFALIRRGKIIVVEEYFFVWKGHDLGGIWAVFMLLSYGSMHRQV